MQVRQLCEGASSPVPAAPSHYSGFGFALLAKAPLGVGFWGAEALPAPTGRAAATAPSRARDGSTAGVA